MRVPHEFRLSRKQKKKCKKIGCYIDFMYTRLVAEEYPYPLYYSSKRHGENIW